MNFVIISLCLLISTIASVLILKIRNNKLISMFSAFSLNILILVGAAWVLYSMDDEAKVFGFGQSGLYILIFSIPIITWINFLILQFVKLGIKQGVFTDNSFL